MNDAYAQGFLQKCAEEGVDPQVLLKAAQVWDPQTMQAARNREQAAASRAMTNAPAFGRCHGQVCPATGRSAAVGSDATSKKGAGYFSAGRCPCSCSWRTNWLHEWRYWPVCRLQAPSSAAGTTSCCSGARRSAACSRTRFPSAGGCGQTGSPAACWQQP